MENKKLIITLGLTLSFIIGATSSSNALSTVDQLKGSDRFETAALIASKQSYKTAIIVNSDKTLADGLSASGLAGAENAPILLVKQNQIPTVTMSKLNGVEKVYIIGTEDTISSQVETEIRDKDIETERLAGEDRCETSLAIANKIKEIKSIDKVIFANAYKGEADAISASSVASRDGVPIILTEGKGTDFDLNGLNRYAIGSNLSLSDKFVSDIGAKRLGGVDRFDTNKKLIQWFYKDYGEVYLSQAYNLVDALAVSPLAKNKPVVLVHKNSDKSILKNTNKFTILGGIDKVAVQQSINAATNNKPNEQGFYFDIDNPTLNKRIKDHLYNLINIYRKENGQSVLSQAKRLEGLAGDWSKLMAKNNTMSHVINGKNSYSTFMQYLDWSPIPAGHVIVQGENLFKYKVGDKYVYTQRDANNIAQSMLGQWKKSEADGGVNMLHPGFEIMGFGMSTKSDKTMYATQEFYGVYQN
ncbi:cell wall-binding repeat-containing protein [Metaclostridioides mangenotii]|uniref:cell wall-binding repeat-containing protein n=1 Tax=Metaclostridioides mangenotii TaxID=1540 RepID=UPI0004638213|nr:cell wall-binding repeat-containing protein [Clostridioides mangenotii]